MLPRLSQVIFTVRQNLIYVGLLYDIIFVTNQKQIAKTMWNTSQKIKIISPGHGALLIGV